MKTIIILVMIFGLYACDESTVTQPKDDTKVETQKYTLEEILADTNWVEITDTLHYSDRFLIGYSFLIDNWNMYSLIKFNNLEEFKNIELFSDTTILSYKKGRINYNIDFLKYSLIGYKTQVVYKDYNKLFYKNEKINQYQYFVIIPDSLYLRPNFKGYHMIMVPKLNNNYILFGDTVSNSRLIK